MSLLVDLCSCESPLPSPAISGNIPPPPPTLFLSMQIGATSPPDDTRLFLSMLIQRGQVVGPDGTSMVRVLSPAAVADMVSYQALGDTSGDDVWNTVKMRGDPGMTFDVWGKLGILSEQEREALVDSDAELGYGLGVFLTKWKSTGRKNVHILGGGGKHFMLCLNIMQGTHIHITACVIAPSSPVHKFLRGMWLSMYTLDPCNPI
jgi:hypothetical protein